MAHFIQEGNHIDHTPVAAVTAGSPVKLGPNFYGIAERAIAAGAKGAVSVKGVYSFTSSSAVTIGAVVYLDADGKITTTAATGTIIGRAVTAASAAESTVLVRINDGLSVTEVTAEAATEAEVKTGTDDGVFITPRALASGSNEDDGYVKINQAAVIVDLTDAATGAEIAAAVNAVIAVLKTHGLIATA